jgi:hypothetical protein
MDQLCYEFPHKLPKFAVMFAALISELDHPGVDNEYLTNDPSRFGEEYKGNGITQNHAFELAWIIFSDKKYQDLRSRLCPTDEALGYFRRLVHDFVLATDVMNPILSAARKRRWETVFGTEEQQQQQQNLDSSCDSTNNSTTEKAVRRKIFSILEHLMLTAHLTHTTQAWSFYIDWNERLYREVTVAFVEGKVQKSPTDSWYHGELVLFDNVVIPLAERLKQNEDVFQNIGSELLVCATKNRNLWEMKGKGRVEEMRAAVTGEKRVHFA